MHPAIETFGLTKQYPAVKAVDDVSLRVERGEVYAFLGLNGAGKTTTIRMLLGMIRNTAGTVRVLGHPVPGAGNELWASVGYLVETPHAWPELTVRENLEVLRRLRPGVPPLAVADIIERLGLHTYADRRAGTLSLGNVQRLGLAKALLHAPELLILDEPANGLDPAGIVEIRELLRSLAHEKGVTIFMSSHILGEVSRLADRIGIIHEGRLLEELDIEEMEKNRRRRLLVETRDLVAGQAQLVSAGFSPLIDATGVISLTDTAALAHPEDVAALLVRAENPPFRIQLEQEDLEHYFLRLVGMENGEGI
ncbi:MAG: ABC transporter ATP-binding protein [Bacteroidetes bacterium]|nr:ABC transporter ATP-binding protein [Bacteroidota bacterium]